MARCYSADAGCDEFFCLAETDTERRARPRHGIGEKTSAPPHILHDAQEASQPRRLANTGLPRLFGKLFRRMRFLEREGNTILRGPRLETNKDGLGLKVNAPDLIHTLLNMVF
jgi:hypothetical protein